MPFSPERTTLIKLRIQAKLESGALNGWGAKFLSDMETRFATYGERTRLSGPQYRKLASMLKLSTEKKVESGGQRGQAAGEHDPRMRKIPALSGLVAPPLPSNAATRSQEQGVHGLPLIRSRHITE